MFISPVSCVHYACIQDKQKNGDKGKTVKIEKTCHTNKLQRLSDIYKLEVYH